MEDNIIIDDSLIKDVVFGRIEHKIYAFETDTIPKYLKVGDTFRSVDERLNEWKRNGFADLRKIEMCFSLNLGGKAFDEGGQGV